MWQLRFGTMLEYCISIYRFAYAREIIISAGIYKYPVRKIII